MSLIQTLSNAVAALMNWKNSVEQNAKTTAELEEMTVLDTTGLLRIFKSGESKKITPQQIIDAARLGLNGLGSWQAGTYTAITGVIRYNKIWLLSDTTSLPFVSVDFDLEAEAGNWIIPQIPTTVQLAESPNSIVFNLGDITDLLTDNDFVEYINTNGDIYTMLETDKTYYFRFINNGIDYLYSYDSDAGGFNEYGDGSGNTMLPEYLHLFYNAQVITPGTGSASPIPYPALRLKAKGSGNVATTLEAGDIVEGFKDSETYWTSALFNGGEDETDRDNYTPLVETSLT